MVVALILLGWLALSLDPATLYGWFRRGQRRQQRAQQQADRQGVSFIHIGGI